MGGTVVGHGPQRSILHRGIAPLVGIWRPCCDYQGIGEDGKGWQRQHERDDGRMAAMGNDDMASTTHVNTSANESPRDEQNFK